MMGSRGAAGTGGGSGGRVAIYHANELIHQPFRGQLEAYGGTATSGGEPGAAGTIYLKNTVTNHTVMRIDNKGTFNNNVYEIKKNVKETMGAQLKMNLVMAL